ncbi:AAA family ATPase [Natronosalvus caseinilyticus]|uniref:AAA family ATPase n=1 Tax=Natronosalvus caseinilyticus TaxID=2953747 RepID=UPI0028A7804C|nr:AAA family ATPase [Natronosalvus caseinilyticus]
MPDRQEIIESIIDELEIEDLVEEDINECRRLLEENYRDLNFPADRVTIRRIQAKNFRNLDDRIVRMDDTNTALYGENESGKTTIFEAIRFNLFGRQEKQRITLTDPIQDEQSTLETTGNWSVDANHYLVYRTMSWDGPGYADDDRPKLNTDPSSEDEIPFHARNTQQDVSEAFGIWPVESREFGRYNIFSMFCLMSPNYKKFINWQNKAGFIDLLFGIDLAAPINESKKRRKEVYELTDEEETSPENLARAEGRENNLRDRLEELLEVKEETETILADRRSELRSINETLDQNSDLERLESEKLRLQRQINNLESERRETRGDLREARLNIKRYEEMEMGEELHSTAQDLQQLMTVPDRCPICTNDVDDDQRQRLLNDAACPLCSKDVPDKRIETGTEQDVRETIAEQDQLEEKIGQFQSRERELEGELNLLDSRIQDHQDQLDRVVAQIEESDANQLVDRRNELETEISELEREATSTQVEINAKQDELEDVADRLESLEEAYERRTEKMRKWKALQAFERIVRRHIEEERTSLKADFEDEMSSLLSYFEHGRFASARNVEFNSQGGYDFTVMIDNGDDIPSDRHNEFSNEGKILALLFHTAVLKLLAEQSNTLPIRMFLLDAPYSEIPDEGNTPDITNFLLALPEELPDYQILLTVTDSALSDRDEFNEAYQIKDF